MRKRSGRQPRYAAIPNETIDDAPHLDFMALGLLNVLLRHRDGWDITLAEIGSKYGYGRDAMSGAMGLLQVARYVIKIRLMSVEGNQWSTEVCVYDTPATNAEVAALLADTEAEPGVKRVQVIEPTKTAVEAARKRLVKLQPKRKQAPSVAVPRVSENPHSDATCGNNAKSQVSPECRDSRQSGDPAVFKKTVVQKEREDEEAVSPRSGGDGRSPSTSGSREAGDEGGFAASGKTSPSPTPTDDTRGPARGQNSGSKKAAHTREQLDVVRQVRAFYPPEIRDDLPDLPAISEAILSTMAKEGRSVEQMGQRILSRWLNHNYAAKFGAGELENLVGAAIGMVRPLVPGDRYACPDIQCEDGVVDEEPCRLCAVRIADRDAARGRERGEQHGQVAPVAANDARQHGSSTQPVMPPQRAAQPAVPLLRDCANDQCSASIPATGNPLCLPCQDDQAEAEWAAQATLGTTAQEVQEEVDEDALETARLRAEIAAQYGTPEQKAAYCGGAPF